MIFRSNHDDLPLTYSQALRPYIHIHYACSYQLLYLRSSVVPAVHRRRKDVGSIPAGGPTVVDEFFSTVPG